MTYATINTEQENAGSKDVVYHTINITSLDGAGTEPYDPAAAVGISDASIYGVSVRGQETASLAIGYDHINGNLTVNELSDGTATTAGTDVGEVLLEVVGQ